MPYDHLKDFVPICLVASVPNMLVVHPSVPVHSVKDLVDLARAKPGTLNYGSTGNGTTGHLSGELLNERAGINLVHVPYRGATAVTDLLGGQVQLMFATIPSVIQHVRSGSLRAIAVTSSRRSPALPEIPTIAESGYPDFEAGSWFGFVAPTGTPEPIVRKLHAQIAAIVRMPTSTSSSPRRVRIPSAARPRSSGSTCGARRRNGQRSSKPPASGWNET